LTENENFLKDFLPLTTNQYEQRQDMD